MTLSDIELVRRMIQAAFHDVEIKVETGSYAFGRIENAEDVLDGDCLKEIGAGFIDEPAREGSVPADWPKEKK